MIGASLGTLGGATFVWSWQLRRAAAARTFTRTEDVPPRAWAIVPGAHVRADGQPSVPLADRLAGALALLVAGRVERVLLSGNNRTLPQHEVDVMAAWMANAGVAASVLARDDHGDRTIDTMRNARREHGIAAAIVCTQAFHMPRSLYLARAAGIDAVGLATDTHAYANATRDVMREHLARTKALIDVALLGRAQ